jgi:tetratricopeptide (TPR) repeat protein
VKPGIDSHVAKEKVGRLASEYRRLGKEKSYERAKIVLEEIVALIEGHREHFQGAEDSIRTYKEKKLMMDYYAREWALSLQEKAAMLREAAALSTPSACDDQPCASLDAELCLSRSRQGKVTSLQSKMCAEKISHISDALKFEAAAAKASRNPDYGMAAKKHGEAATIHEAAVQLDPHPGRLAHQRYLDYWHWITAGQVSLQAGDFGGAKDSFQKALEFGKTLDAKKCFPNFFRNLKEIQEHETYIDGVSLVSQGKFDEAATLFAKWLNRFPELDRENDLRFDNVRVYRTACEILHARRRATSEEIDWNRRFAFLRGKNVSLPTWALLRRLRALCHRPPVGGPQILGEEVNWFSQNWALFVPDSVLLAEDKTAGAERRVNLPSFLNVFDRLEQDNAGNWQKILVQNLKNLLLIMADYERRRHDDPPPDEQSIPRLPHRVAPSESLTIHQLVETTLRYLRRREPQLATNVGRALQQLEPLRLAIESGDFDKAVETERDIFEQIRSWPHTIQVLDQRQVPRYPFGQQRTRLPLMETEAVRLWDRVPRKITFVGKQQLEKGGYYYLRPHWNIRLDRRFENRHEQFHRSDTPKWCATFFENLFGASRFEPDRFRDWILQFEDSERLLACQLSEMLQLYGEDDVREMWLRLFREKLPPEAKIRKVNFFGLGHTAKSGHRSLYAFQKAVRGLGENERSFVDEEAFREIAVFDNPSVVKPQTVVFIDDFVGRGVQAVDYLFDCFKKHPWLSSCRAYYCALVGFSDGVKEIKADAKPSGVADIFVAKELLKSDRAFAEENPAWSSQDARLEAKRWAEKIGYQVLGGNPNYVPERDKLGWRDSQALVAFSYNVPNNTLPLYWGTGARNGKTWRPLVSRLE